MGRSPSAGFLATLATVLALSPHRAQAGSWSIETVELLPGVGPYYVLSLALDAQGNPHLSYLELGALVHAFKEAGSWNTEVVDSLGLG